MRRTRLSLLLAATAVLLDAAGVVRAASHSDAPLIKQDPQANLTDVYAFIGTQFNNTNQKVLNIVVQVHPFCEPGDGVIYDRFSPTACYSIHLTNPKTGATVIRYDFKFSSVAAGYKNLDTILSYGRGTQIGAIQDVGDARQNYVQTYSVTEMINGQSRVLGTGLQTPPPNVGNRVTPFYNDANGRAVSGATTFAALDKYTKQTIQSLPRGLVSWAGMREDSFYADIPGIFDLLNPRILGPDGAGQTGNGVDGFKGYNVLVFALQVPVTQLQSIPNFPSVGVYASVSRPMITLRNSGLNGEEGFGPMVQVNRMGNPLFNEALVALRDKDNYNFAAPTADTNRFKQYAQAPEVIVLLNTVFGTQFQTNNRTDLVGIYIPDVLRVDSSTEAVRLAGQAGFSRLSLFGGDKTSNGTPSGWPNGRRFGDDVVDIALTAIASGPGFAKITPLGDNVNANDQVYNQVFPYAATPWAGTRNSKDSGVNKDP
jgi:hypothetical protein